MLITIVNGSPRATGATGKILRAAAEYLAKKPGIEVRSIELSEQIIEPCRGCQQCYRTGRCVIGHDGLEQTLDMLRSSQGIIIGSPTYGSNITGILKNFMDRGHFIMEQALHGKYGLSVSTYEIADGRQVKKILNKFFLMAGASRRGSVLIRTDHDTDPLAPPTHRRHLQRELDRFHRAMVQRAPKTLWELFFTNWFLMKVIWKPFLLERPLRYQAILEQWKAKGFY